MVKKTLVIGASSDLASELIPILVHDMHLLGLHWAHNKKVLEEYEFRNHVKLFQQVIMNEEDCKNLIHDYVEWAAGIDNLLVLMGDINRNCHWSELSYKDMETDYSLNTIFPFLLAKYAFPYMTSNGGRIVFVSTASAQHGGGSFSMGYGMAKAALECATKGLAKNMAKYKILVNAIAPGYMDTKFHTDRMKRTSKELEERALYVPLKRAGTKEEFAGLTRYLLSEEAAFLTGQIITLDGGDFI
ncbi:MAG: SDR family oxidoreductase [Ruminococcus sp.]|nr:SDR family oxidoreductase [Ruminococcus sp.]